MDSFFATANNLDQLLDDLEDDECETEKQKDSTPEFKKPSTNEVHFSAASSIQYDSATFQGADLPPIALTQNNNILISSKTHVDTKEDVLPNGGNTNFTPQNSDQPSMGSTQSIIDNKLITLPPGPMHSTSNLVPVVENHPSDATTPRSSGEKIKSHINEADVSTVDVTTPTEDEKNDSNFRNSEETVDQAIPNQRNGETDSSSTDFVVIEKSNMPEKQDAISNSDFVREVFGVFPTSNVKTVGSTDLTHEPSVAIEKSNDMPEKQGANSDLIMGAFGAVPASNINASEDADSSSVPSGIFSPSNPFRDDYLAGMSEIEKSHMATSAIFDFDTGQSGITSLDAIPFVQNSTNPFYSDLFLPVCNQSQNASSIEDAENTMQRTENKSIIESPPTLGSKKLPNDSGMSSAGVSSSTLKNEASGHSFENIATSMHTYTSVTSNNDSVLSQQQFVIIDRPNEPKSIGDDHSKKEFSQENATSESLAAKDTTQLSKPPISDQSGQDVARSEKNHPQFDQGCNVQQSISNSEQIVAQSKEVVETLRNKQEKASMGFMKEVAVTEEEFQKFWEMELENDVSNESEISKTEPILSANSTENITPGTKNISVPNSGIPKSENFSNVLTSNSENASTIISSSSVLVSEDEQYVDVGSLVNEISDPQQPSQSVDTNFDDGAVNISCIPNDALISESEYEQFLTLEANENSQATFDVDSTITTATNINHIANNSHAAPVSIPVNNVATENSLISISDDHQGSPTFPLHSSITQRPQDLNDTSDVHVQQRLILDVDRSREIQENSGSRYPETPPPPYTQEMHATYERSLSPVHLADRHDGEQSQQHVKLPGEVTSSNNDGDLSNLPSSILESITRPGDTEPAWVRDQDAPQCNNCAVKFSFTKRRHHCRACGRVFCAACCSEKGALKFLGYKEARVCSMCSLAIKQADALAAAMARRTQQSAIAQQPQAATAVVEEASEAISDTATTVPTVNEAVSPLLPDTTQPVVGTTQPEAANAHEDMTERGAVAKTPGSKSVRFSDGTRPKHPDEMPTTPPLPSRVNRVRKRYSYQKDANGVMRSELPPIIIAHGENGEYAVKENPDFKMVSDLLESEGQTPQSFFLNPNLIVHIMFLTYADLRCWCFWSEGMVGVGQKEVVLLLKRQGPDDKMISQDAFALFVCIFERARKGKIFNTMDFMPRTMLSIEEDDELFDVKDTAGFLFVQASSQPLDGLSCLKRRSTNIADGQHSAEDDSLPIRSMLFAILVERTEAPWATLFPMRLMLRLGMETKQYPCPLFSVRGRQPVYSDVGHTILAILCDFRNFKYKVVSVPGLRVVVSANGTVSVQIPCNRFSDTVKIMNSSNESVLAIGTGTFGPKFRPREEMTTPSDCPCDSHLVCVQDPKTSTYHTEIIGMEGVEALNTGAAFVIFNGSLKSDGNHQAKCAIVEDGIMVQLLPEKMEMLRASLKSMEDFQLRIGSVPQSENAEGTPVDGPIVEVKWVEDDTAFNIGMFSPIDRTPFEGVVGFNVQGKSEQKGKKYILRWNQVFFHASTSDPLDMSRLAEQVANGCFLALTGVLHELVKHRQQKIAIRVTIHPENVGYVAGSESRDLPTACMNALDDNLIQTIHNAAAHVPAEHEAVIIELLFSILLSKPAYRTP